MQVKDATLSRLNTHLLRFPRWRGSVGVCLSPRPLQTYRKPGREETAALIIQTWCHVTRLIKYSALETDQGCVHVYLSVPHRRLHDLQSARVQESALAGTWTGVCTRVWLCVWVSQKMMIRILSGSRGSGTCVVLTMSQVGGISHWTNILIHNNRNVNTQSFVVTFANACDESNRENIDLM